MENVVSKENQLFLQGGGEMGDIVRAYNWEKSSLRAPNNWPTSLQTTLGIILHSKFPMFLFWGPQSICFYNDAYRPSLGNNGKHPYALGKPAAEVWPEIWKDIHPQIEDILQGGEASWHEDQLLPIYRNGKLEDVYWTYSYSPVIDESGIPAGVFVTCTETTKTVVAKKKLEESEQALRNIILQAPFAACIFRGKEFVVEVANEKMFRFWGKSAGEVLNIPLFKGIPEAIGQGFEELMMSVLETGEPFTADELPVTLPRNGKVKQVYINFSYDPLRDVDDVVTGIIATAMDVTEQVLVRKQLEESEKRFRTIVEQTPTPIALTRGPDMVFESINEPMLRLVDRTNVIGKTVAEVFPELKETLIENILNKVWDTGEEFQGSEVPFTLNVEGKLQLKYYNLVYKPIEENNSVSKIIHVAIDVTEQVNARKKVEASEARFENLIREASVGIVVLIGEEMRVSVVNSAYGRLINRNVDELLNQALFDVIPDAETTFHPLLDKVRLTGEPIFLYDTPYLVYTKGEKVEGFINVVYQPYRELDGRINGVMVLCQDVTQQVVARQKLEEADERARLSIEAGELGTIEVNLQTDEVITSKRMEEIFEIKPGDGRSAFVSKMYEEDLPKRTIAYEKALQNGLLEYEGRVLQNNGSLRWIRVKGRVFFDEMGKPKRLVSVVQDISKEKYFTEELQKQVSERTKELERSNDELLQFAHVASHDLKEPVRKIRIFGNRLKLDFSNILPDRALVYLEKMENASNRIYSMIDGVLLYSSLNGAQLTKEPVDLNVVIRQIEEDLEVAIQQTEAVICVEQLPVIEGSQLLLYQLFYNLISNSLKFRQSGTLPVIEIQSQILDGIINQAFDYGRYAIIRIRDNGIGFQQAQAEKIFSTFTRLNSKDKFEGTGLGLSLCKKIAERHGGSIHAQSVESKGATFVIHLPLQQPG